jgi:hypothetical protein
LTSTSQSSRFATILSTEQLPPTGEARKPDQVPTPEASQARGSVPENALQMGFGDTCELPAPVGGLEYENIPPAVRLVVKAVSVTSVPGVTVRLLSPTITMKQRPADDQSRAKPLLSLIPAPKQQKNLPASTESSLVIVGTTVGAAQNTLELSGSRSQTDEIQASRDQPPEHPKDQPQASGAARNGSGPGEGDLNCLDHAKTES